ncbi:MAG: malto-oligosyltrehalose synthase, partial [Nocardioides sp.]
MTAIPREPIATYRVQLTPDFAFAEVVGILDNLVELGISHLYLSPILAAMPGSTHGYDWRPPAQISPALGGLDGYRLLRAHARAVGIGIIVDVVPNHLGVARPDLNPWWADVLRHGTQSEYAHYFDLHPATIDGADNVLGLPYLGSPADLDLLELDDDGNLRLHEWILPTAPGTANPGDDPREVLRRQHYRLIRPHTPFNGYRPFLDIGELAALRVDLPDVFAATHDWLRDMVAEDLLDGVRVDHVDGLRLPVAYLTALRELVGPHRLIYAEKGLGIGEPLDQTLPIDGTTGYDQLQRIEALFTAPPGVIELDEIYKWITGISGDGEQLREAARALREDTARGVFPSRLRWATEAVSAAAESVPTHLVQQAIVAFVSHVTVSRPDYPALAAEVLETIESARSAHPSATAGFDSLTAVLLAPDEYPEAAFRVSELSAVIGAKAIEDIGFHRTARLVSTQELGCNPIHPSGSRTEFHEISQRRARREPLALNALSTHDTKRSADVRSRIAVIAQVPQRWNLLVRQLWRDSPPPHPRTAYLLLQNLIGVWPDERLPDDDLRERLRAYTAKAMREAALISSWSEINEEAERETQEWLSALLTGLPAALITEFVALIRPIGRDEALSRTTISLLGSGVGDLYQGAQWWNAALTDPDNRRPVDYTQSPNHPKFRQISEALAVRRRHPAAFGATGAYREVTVRGARARHVVAFARGRAGGREDVVVVATRLTATFRPGIEREEADVDLPAGRWR